MAPKKNKKNKRKNNTPKKRFTRLNPNVDTETENDSQPDEERGTRR